MRYFSDSYLTALQGEAIDFIERNCSDYVGYDDFIELVSTKDTDKDFILNEIDRDYLNDFIKYKEFYTILDSVDEIDEILGDDYINYFMDYDLLTLLDYFTEISFVELLTYVDIYKHNNVYYAVWDI